MYLSISQQGVHPLQESSIQHVGLVQNEHYLLAPTARASQHSTKVVIKVCPSVLAMDLEKKVRGKMAFEGSSILVTISIIESLKSVNV